MHPNNPAASTQNTSIQKPVQPKLSFEKQHNMNDRKVAVDDQLMKPIVGKDHNGNKGSLFCVILGLVSMS